MADLAEDAAQEAVARAWRHAGSYRGEGLTAWIRTIARREALRLSERQNTWEPEDQSPEAGSEGQTELIIQRLDVSRALSVLNASERQAVLLRYWADMSDRQIASAVQAPPGTVKIRLHRAREKLSGRSVPLIDDDFRPALD